MNVELPTLAIMIIMIMISEYLLIDMHYFYREDQLRKELFYQNMETINKIAKIFKHLDDDVEVSFEKRIKCPACGYPMKILKETDDHYQCYCADCGISKTIKK